MRLIEIQKAKLYIRKSPDPVGIALKKTEQLSIFGLVYDYLIAER